MQACVYLHTVFRTAKEAEDLIRKAKGRGETLPSDARFDSNCITPGFSTV